MSYTLSALTTVADCDAILKMAHEELDDLVFHKLSVERQQKAFSQSATDVTADLAAVTAELDAVNTTIATLPDGKTKDKQIKRQKRLEYDLFLLNSRKNSSGGVALVGKQFDLERTIQEIAVVEAFIAAVEARKVELS